MASTVIRKPPATEISEFEPLLPSEAGLQPLLELAHELQKRCWKLSGNPMPGLLIHLTPFLRAMNSYYTNKIEGQQTLPADIEDALQNRFSKDLDKARKQRLALAHLATEEWGETEIATRGWRNTFNPDSILDLHRHLYEQLLQPDRVTETGEPIQEGELRNINVKVDIHMGSAQKAVPHFLKRWADFYSSLPEGERTVVGIACAHHRLVWVHPFLDGNGQVARLQSYLALHALGLTNGLWSPMRGLARNQAEYYSRLGNADEPRLGDYDGRGALTEKGLIDFAKFFLELRIDQAVFMEQMLNLADFKDRLKALLAYESAKEKSEIRVEALTPLHYIAINGLLERGEFKAMTGLAPRTAERLLKALLDYGLLKSDTPKGRVYLGIPLESLRFLFPNLWPEAEADSTRKK